MQGAFAYMKHANTYNLRNKLIKQIEAYFPNEISEIEINRYLKITHGLNYVMEKYLPDKLKDIKKFLP
jgi:hypothetical protein